MKKSILLGLFLISLAFNIAFIGLYVHHQLIMRKRGFPPPPIEKVYHHHPWLERKDETIRELRHDFLVHKRHFMEQIRENELSVPELEKELDSLLEKQMRMEEHIGKFMIEMRQNLSDEQVECFYRRVPKKPDEVRKERLESLKNRRKQ